jgi:4-hydroxybenzoyl-CoA reductase subunit beta
VTLIPEFQLHRPATVEEAARIKAASANGQFVAGGTDLMPNLRRGLGQPSDLIDLSAIADFGDIRRDGASLWIGAGVTLAALARDPLVLAEFPALAEAALSVAGPTHRVMATLGGNLCQDTRCIFYNQSEWWREGNGWCLKYQGDKCHVVVKSDRCYATYHGDVAPALMVLGAEVIVVGPAGPRRFPLADLFVEDGSTRLTLQPGEVLTVVVVPAVAGRRAAYEKVRIRDAVDFPLAGVAVALRRDKDRIADIRVAITGTNSAPLLIATDGLIGKPWNDETAKELARVLRAAANVLRTTVMGTKYRRRAMQALARRLVDSLWNAK